MLCPHDKINLQTISIKETNIDLCPSCHGIFLDNGELKKLVEIYGNSSKFIENTEKEIDKNIKSEID